MSKKKTQDGISCLKEIIRLANSSKTTEDEMTDGAREFSTVAIAQIESFLPTHYRVTQWIIENGGSENLELVDFAHDLTNEFEKIHKDTDWDVEPNNWDFALDIFLQNKFKALKNLIGYKKPEEKIEFPNGFSSWRETFFEVVDEISAQLRGNKADDFRKRMQKQYHISESHMDMHELAKLITDEFEQKNKGREWDGEFWDEIEAFIHEKLA